MADPNKPPGRDMHQEPMDEFFPGDGDFFPLPLIFIILGSKSNRTFSHALDTIVADGDPVGIFSQIFDHGLCAIKRLLTVRNPFFSVTGVNKFLESIMVFVTLCAAVEYELVVFPKLLQLSKILSAKEA